MQEKTTRNIYNVWAYFYDMFWPGIVHRRTTRAIEQMYIRPEESVLDIGVGTGLGLSITYGLVQELNGDLKVKSRLGKGTTFHIKLPIKKSEE